MGKNKKYDEYDISIEDQLALLYGDDGGETEDLGVSGFAFEGTIESALLEKMEGGVLTTTSELKYSQVNVSSTQDKIDDDLDENLKVTVHQTEVEVEVENTIKPKSNLKFIQAKFSREMKTVCISNNKQMFSVGLDNLPPFNNDINNDIDVITMVRDAVIRKMITCFEPTMIMTVDSFESNIGSVLDSLGKDVHIFIHDDEDLVLLYNLSDKFMDEIDDIIEIAIEENKVFPMFAALVSISSDRYFKCNIDRLLMKKLEDISEYVTYIMAKPDVMYMGADIDNSIEKFKPIDIDDVDDMCSKAIDIINRIMDKVWGLLENEVEPEGE